MVDYNDAGKSEDITVRREEIGYKQLLMWQMNDCRRALSMSHEYGVDVVRSSIGVLEDMLAPYWDKEYRDYRNELTKIKPEDIIQAIQSDILKQKYTFEKQDIMRMRSDWIIFLKERIRFKELMNLCARKNLLLIEEIELTVPSQ